MQTHPAWELTAGIGKAEVPPALPGTNDGTLRTVLAYTSETQAAFWSINGSPTLHAFRISPLLSHAISGR